MELSGTSGTIASPEYHYDYEDATWTITVELRHRILITFKEMNLAMHPDDSCMSQIEIFDGPNENAPSLGSFCGYTKQNPVKSTSNVVHIKNSFYSSSRTKTSFVLEWLQVEGNKAGPFLPHQLPKSMLSVKKLI